jgi:NADPH:quinone reductase-like Zn-dependent oxidoreductase
MQDTMTAVVQDEYGTDPNVVLGIEEIARPSAGKGEVLVRTRAAAVDRGTWHVMTGLPLLARLASGLRRPKVRVPGRDVAGTVEAVGRDVTGFAPGDEVYGSCGATRSGSFAEFGLARANRLAHKPADLTFEQAAAVPISGLTAIQAVRKAKVQAGQSVAVLGASGGVGSYVVQIAKAAGAEVTGVCSTAKVDLVQALGADHVVDYTQRDYAEDGPYDIVLDIGGSRTLGQLRRALTPKGRLVIVGGETDGRWLGGFDRQFRAGLLSPFVSQTLGQVASREKAEDLVALRELIEAGQVTPAVGGIYPLAEAATAMRHLIDGQAQGKLVLTV